MNVEPRMRTAMAFLLFASVAAACSGSLTAMAPVPIVPDVQDILDGWHTADVTCGPPEEGMPGPALQWSCRGRFDGVDLTIEMIADRFGLQSIVVDAPAGSAQIGRAHV
jgi:hypothetical protein